jgi:GT2 family glycosyltransferase
MKFTLIICTYMRPKALLDLLNSVVHQTVYPNQILIVDGSLNIETQEVLKEKDFQNLEYFRVSNEDRGLTRQRNFGISKVSNDTEVVCFLDDDTILEKNYFEELLKTYSVHPEALGVGGYIIIEEECWFVGDTYEPKITDFYFDGWVRKEGIRFIARKIFGLDSDYPPGFSSLYSHGRSVGFLPPSGKIYEVEQFMGGVSSFRKSVFEEFSFSTYFEGYGLYEDADFCLRLAKKGKLYLNTNAKLYHHHDDSGRPNQYKYGKMVVRNGWYVWRVKNPKPLFNAKMKWHAITILLLLIRFSNTFNTDKKRAAITEAIGRTVGWWSLILNKPKMS